LAQRKALIEEVDYEGLHSPNDAGLA
jgi:hypothetical protein